MYQFANNAVTTLSANLSASALSINVTDGSIFPSTGTFRITLWGVNYSSPKKDENQEIVEISSRSGNVLTVRSRGKESTSGVAHLQYDNVALLLTNEEIEHMIEHKPTTTVGEENGADFSITEYDSDDEAMQASIDYVNDQGSGEVNLLTKPDNYDINNTEINIKSSSVFSGHKYGSIVDIPYLNRYGDYTHALLSESRKNIDFKDLYIKGQHGGINKADLPTGTSDVYASGDLIRLTDSSNVLIDNLTGFDGFDGIRITESSSDVNISNCQFINDEHGIAITTDCSNINISNILIATENVTSIYTKIEYTTGTLVGTFTFNESLLGGSSGATAIFKGLDTTNEYIIVDNISGTFESETITGQSSSATIDMLASGVDENYTRTGLNQRGIGVWNSGHVNINNIDIKDSNTAGIFVRNNGASAVTAEKVNISNVNISNVSNVGVQVQSENEDVKLVFMNNMTISSTENALVTIGGTDNEVKEIFVSNCSFYSSDTIAVKNSAATILVERKIVNDFYFNNTIISGSTAGLLLERGEDIFISNCKITGRSTAGIQLAENNNIGISNIVAAGVTKGISITDQQDETAATDTKDIRISNSYLKASNGKALDFVTAAQNISNVIVTGVHLETSAGAFAAIQLIAHATDSISEVKFIGCYIKSAKLIGVFSGDSNIKDITFQNCTIIGATDGLRIEGGENIRVRSCDCYGTSGYGGYFKDIDNLEIDDCYFEGGTNDLLFSTGVTGLKVTNCRSSAQSVSGYANVHGIVSGNDFDTQTLTGAGSVLMLQPNVRIVTNGVNALTLTDGVEGEERFLVMKTNGGDGTLTPTNLYNGSTITFDTVGDSAHLKFMDGKWVWMGGTATLA